MRARDERLELDRRAGDGLEVLGKESFDLLVPSDAPERASAADLVMAEVIGLGAEGTSVVLAGAERPDV